MVKSKKDQLEKIDEQLKKLKEKQKKLRAKEAKKERELEKKRNILVGKIVRKRVKDGKWPEDRFLKMIDEDLTKDYDRKLFDLPIIKNNNS